MEKIIRVTGEGKAFVKPDTIEVGLQISGINKVYSKSLEEVDNKVISLKDEMKKIGIENVKTSSFSIRPRTKRVYERNNNYNDVFEGYETLHSLKISFDFDTAKLGEVVEKIADSIAQPRLSISFTAKNLDGVKEEALAFAVASAKNDAIALAKASGVELGDIVTINHSFGEVRVYRPREAELMADYACEGKMRAGSSLGGISVEDISVEANVTIEWQIR